MSWPRWAPRRDLGPAGRECVSACAKHFPGLGPATLDPHLHLPSIDVTWQELERIHMVPFMRAMRTGVQSIMTSHPLYPKLDPTPKNAPPRSRASIVHDLFATKPDTKVSSSAMIWKWALSQNYVLSVKRR